MAKKLKFLAFSDLHINLWKKFPTRLATAFKVLDVISDRCESEGVPALFCGDLFHTSEFLNNELLSLTVAKFRELDNKSWKCFAISGNHTQSDNSGTHSYEKTFSLNNNWLQCIDFNGVHYGNTFIFGIPYVMDNVGVKNHLKTFRERFKSERVGKEHTILLLHTDYDGARDTDGRVIGTVENLPRIGLRNFDLVLCGHIHKYQKLDKNVWMVGAPYQQRFTDEGNEMGYLEIYDDFSVKFRKIKGNPEFITVSSEEEKKDDGNYYRTEKEQKVLEIQETSSNITKDMSKEKIIRKYLRAKNITDKGKKRTLLKVIKEAEEE